MSDPPVKKYTAAGARLRAGFTAVPNLVVRDRELGGLEIALYAILLDLAWTEEEPEMGDLAARLGVSEKPCRAVIKRLETRGLVTTKRRGQGLTNAYTIHEPGEVQTGSSARSGSVAEPDPPFVEDEVKTEPQEQAPVVRPGEISTRPRNIVYDAICAATAANPAEGGKIGKAIKSIKAAAADALSTLASPEAQDAWLAGEIVKRARAYREQRPEWELTPTALASHWNRIPTWTARGGGKLTPQQIAQMEER